MNLADVRVGAIEYSVGNEFISARWYGPEGSIEQDELGPTRVFLPRAEQLRHELRDTMAIARGRVARLRDFAEDWGRDLLPARLIDSPPDVLVIVPHSFLHGVPFHLVKTGRDGKSLGSLVGVSYASSRSLFVRCASRTPYGNPFVLSVMQ